jgi:hypothetical protein
MPQDVFWSSLSTKQGENTMGKPQESQQKKPQSQSGTSEDRESDFTEQGTGQGKKAWPAGGEEDESEEDESEEDKNSE